jgi:hypothetical protein
VIGAAVMAAKIATGEIEEDLTTAQRSAAAELGSQGGKGCAVWKRILAAVAELTRTTPAEGEPVN